MKLNKILKFLDKPIKNKHIRYGLPFLCFIGVGLLVIRECATVRYQFRKIEPLDREGLKALGVDIKDRAETLEEAYEKYLQMDIDNWENKRGPRLWEENEN